MMAKTVPDQVAKLMAAAANKTEETKSGASGG
jgi:hypothetical protein